MTMLSAKVICLIAFGLTVFSTTDAVSTNLDKQLAQVEQDVTTYPYHKDFKTCPVSLDIAYLIDGSDSIDAGEFNLEKTVVKVMAYFFGVMKLGTHNGVIVFSDNAKTEIKFSDYYEFNGFREAVKRLTKPGGGTRIDRALEEAHDNLFMGGGGSRPSKDITKIAVVFTDGVSGGQTLDTAVKQLEDKGVIVFAVGIGEGAQLTQLRQLVARDDLVFHTNDFLDLYIKAGFIARRICQHAQHRGAPGPTGPQGPDGPAGLRGPSGPAGLAGARGSTGAHGPKGGRGAPGPAGEDGNPGIPGANGAPGPQGAKGPKGARGDAGAAGDRGQRGDDGSDGDTGPRGSKGEQGPQGAKGDAGDNGNNGADGANGKDGQKGERGPAGDRGDQGASGADGGNGATGPKGQAGPDGADGAQGKIGAPGPKGDRGPRGADGARGEVGEPGAPGVDGAAGAHGDPGDGGSRGPRGPTGPVGPKGSKGQPGNDGVNGSPGPRGPKGGAGIPGTDSRQKIVCVYKQSAKGQDSMSCQDPTTTATDCGCARGCGEWSVSEDGQTCTCLCNTYVPQNFHEVGVNCCKLQ